MPAMMKHHVQSSADAAAKKAAKVIADLLNEVLSSRPSASVAFSGGSTPNRMFQYLTQQDIDWTRVEIFQVDERIAPAGDPARNLSTLKRNLLDHIDIPEQQIHAMPVEATDLDWSLDSYAGHLKTAAGDPPQLDIIHLGLGGDGHTASLPPGDSVLNSNRLVDICAEFNGYRRMTLTFPVLNQARSIVWLVTGFDKISMLERLLSGDTKIPAGMINQDRATLVSSVD